MRVGARTVGNHSQARAPRSTLAAFATLATLAVLALPLARADDTLAPRGARRTLRASAADQEAQLARALSALLDERRAALGPARVGLAVIEVASGRILFAADGADPFPAIGAGRLMLGAAALATLGPGHRFATTVQLTGWDGVDTAADLFVHGSDDPTLDLGALDDFADELVLLGLRRLTGETHVHRARLAAVPAALKPPPALRHSTSADAMLLSVHAGAPTTPARITLLPPCPHVVLDNAVTSTTGGATALRLVSHAGPDGLRLRVEGTIAAAAPPWFATHASVDSARCLGALLVARLAARGVAVAAGPIIAGPPPDDARLIARRVSPPLAVLVRQHLHHGDRRLGSALATALAAAPPGTAATLEHGLAATRLWLEVAGLAPSTYRLTLRDALFGGDRFTPAQLAGLLAYGARDFRLASELAAALAPAQVTAGRRTNMRWLRLTAPEHPGAALAVGYATPPGQAPVAFALLLAGLPAGPAGVELSDAVAALLSGD